jgi:hypothetical protein
VATCDRLLGDLARGGEQLDARTVLVVDEAGVVGSRKLACLLDHGPWPGSAGPRAVAGQVPSGPPADTTQQGAL